MKFVKAVTGCLAGAILAIAASTSAQMPEAYKFVPSDATMVMRVNVMNMEKSARLGPICEQIKSSAATQLAASPDPLVAIAKDLINEIKIVETGAAGFEMSGKPQHQYVVLYGQFDPAKLMAELSKNGWVEAGKHGELSLLKSPAGDSYLTMPNSWTIAVASNDADLNKMLDTGAGTAPSIKATDGKVAKLLNGVEGSHISIALELPAASRQQMAQQAQMASQQYAMMPGVTQVANNVGQLNSLSISMSEEQSAMLGIALNYDSEIAAQQSGGGLNMLLPMAIGMLSMPMAQDPAQAELVQGLQKLSTVQFAAKGTTTAAAFPIPDKAFAVMQEGIAEQVGGMQFMPGMN